MRKDLLRDGEVYHVFDRSIAEFRIFNDYSEFSRMKNIIPYYQKEMPAIKYSDFIRSAYIKRNFLNRNVNSPDAEKLIEIIAYCIMPTHLHLILKQLKKSGISIFMNNLLNSYTRYFNTKHKRKGPLWEGPFKSVLIKSDEQLLHLTRYIHLNPVTAYLVDKPEDWIASSYLEYLGEAKEKICKFSGILDIEPVSYRKFVEDRISYQRDLAKIKDKILE